MSRKLRPADVACLNYLLKRATESAIKLTAEISGAGAAMGILQLLISGLESVHMKNST